MLGEKPGAAETARARQRRDKLHCKAHLSRFPELVADLRHMEAVAAGDLVAWLADLVAGNYSDRTVYGYGRGVAPLLRAHPEKTVREFTTDDIRAQLALVPARSRHITRAIYSSFFKWLLEQDRIDRDPVAKTRPIREPKRRIPEVYTEAEMAALCALPLPDGPLYAILFGTGARRADARNLQRKYVDLERRRVIFLNGKGGKDGWVPVMPDVIAAVADLDLVERLEPDDYLWYRKMYPVGDRRRRSTGPIGSTTFNEWHARCVESAGVRYLNAHKTRHTYGHWLKRQGFDLGGARDPDAPRVREHDQEVLPGRHRRRPRAPLRGALAGDAPRPAWLSRSRASPSQKA